MLRLTTVCIMHAARAQSPARLRRDREHAQRAKGTSGQGGGWHSERELEPEELKAGGAATEESGRKEEEWPECEARVAGPEEENISEHLGRELGLLLSCAKPRENLGAGFSSSQHRVCGEELTLTEDTGSLEGWHLHTEGPGKDRVLVHEGSSSRPCGFHPGRGS